MNKDSQNVINLNLKKGEKNLNFSDFQKQNIKFDILKLQEFVDGLNGNLDETFSKEDYEPIWKEITEHVDKFNEPGIFPAFIGYEWTKFYAC